MAALKVSLEFLNESVSDIINKSGSIAKQMVNNPVFKLSPISAEGLKTAVDNLREMEKKAGSGKANDIENRNSALGDVDDFIRQIAAYLNQSSDPEKFTGNGFDFTTDPKKSAGEKKVNWTGGLI